MTKWYAGGWCGAEDQPPLSTSLNLHVCSSHYWASIFIRGGWLMLIWVIGRFVVGATFEGGWASFLL
jgi:hypothetical protein